jgi:hypothetical protein
VVPAQLPPSQPPAAPSSGPPPRLVRLERSTDCALSLGRRCLAGADGGHARCAPMRCDAQGRVKLRRQVCSGARAAMILLLTGPPCVSARRDVASRGCCVCRRVDADRSGRMHLMGPQIAADHCFAQMNKEAFVSQQPRRSNVWLMSMAQRLRRCAHSMPHPEAA